MYVILRSFVTGLLFTVFHLNAAPVIIGLRRDCRKHRNFQREKVNTHAMVIVVVAAVAIHNWQVLTIIDSVIM